MLNLPCCQPSGVAKHVFDVLLSVHLQSGQILLLFVLMHRYTTASLKKKKKNREIQDLNSGCVSSFR